MTEEENIVKTELNLEYYINWYANEFTKYFPNIYTKDNLLNMLHSTLEHIYKVEKNDQVNYLGKYVSSDKSIRIINENNSTVLFHEFTHALRKANVKKEALENHYVFNAKYSFSEEGIVNYISILYSLRKKELNNNINTFTFTNKDYTKYNSYDYSSCYYSQLHHMYNAINKKNDFIKEYLSGTNIRKNIYEVINTYILKLCEYEKIKKDKNEIQLLSLRLSNMIFTYLSDFGHFNRADNLLENKIDRDELINELSILEKINKQILLVFLEFNLINKDTFNYIGKTFLTDKVYIPNSKEEKLLFALFNENINLDIMKYEEIEEIVYDFIVKSDEISDRKNGSRPSVLI